MAKPVKTATHKSFPDVVVSYQFIKAIGGDDVKIKFLSNGEVTSMSGKRFAELFEINY